MKHTWWKLHSYPTSPSRCFTDKWKKYTPYLIFLQRKIFGTKFGSFCTIQKRFDQNWITNSIAVRVYFWALFANLDFPNSLLAPLHYAAIPLKKWKLEIQDRFPPQHPFSCFLIISDRNIWRLPAEQFHFWIIFGYELNTVYCSS